MQDMKVYDIMGFPAEQIGDGVKRDIRIAVSPQTTGEERATFVHCTLPPNSISNGHIHPGEDEYIYFDIGGKAILDGVVYEVPPKALVHARAGSVHECINTSKEKTLTLFCIFLPALTPYGIYPQLIEKTREHLKKQ